MDEADVKKTRIAAVGDIHIREADHGKWTEYFKTVSREADVLLLCGDLTDNGRVHEAEILAEELKVCSIPVVAVLGNHDYDLNEQDAIKKILSNDNVFILDGEWAVVGDLGFAGIKGFGGGFDQFMLSTLGEQTIKKFVQETVDDALRLDRALTFLDRDYAHLKKIVLLHYAPIKATILGEPEPIYPFLGSSHLADPINRRKVEAVFHGHAHSGTLEGTTSKGVKVFNVAKPLLLKSGYQVPYYLFEV